MRYNRDKTNVIQGGHITAMKLDYDLGQMPADIARHTTHRVFLPGTAVVSKGGRADHVYIIIKGNVRVSNEFISGQRYTFAAMGPLELIGDLEVLADQPVYSATCEATVSCECIGMSAATFLRWIKSDSDFAFAVSRQLAAKMYPTSNENGRIKFQPSLERLHDYLKNRLGDIDTDLFILHTSRQQIADDIGTSVKTVNRGVAKLKEAGLIGLLHGKITLDRQQQAEMQLPFDEEE